MYVGFFEKEWRVVNYRTTLFVQSIRFNVEFSFNKTFWTILIRGWKLRQWIERYKKKVCVKLFNFYERKTFHEDIGRH